ncbi:MAG: hypothetical protein PHH14_00180 [Candidatus Margulisbacteria bacterium]|nr:hypothetical protein [Candidatus Margulisiibacteriota bacterium]
MPIYQYFNLAVDPICKKGRANNSAVKTVINVELKGVRRAQGKAVIVDPERASVTLYHHPEAPYYDFSRFTLVDQNVTGKPPAPGLTYKAPPGKRLVEIVDSEVVFACCGETNGLWAPNSVIVADGEVIKREAPGIHAKEKYPLEGKFPFFVFDEKKRGLNYLLFAAGELKEPLVFSNGIYGPVLIRDCLEVLSPTEEAYPPIKPNQVPWAYPKIAAIAAVGLDIRGDFIFLAMAGDPKEALECSPKDITDILMQLQTREAILLGLSADVQQYIKYPNGQKSWLVGKPRPGSSMETAFPQGRPISNAILVKDKTTADTGRDIRF